MPKIFILVAIILALVLAQTAVFPKAELWGARPDLVMTMVIIWSLLKADYQESWLLALGGGFLLDINSGLPFGVITLSLFLTVFLISRLTTDVFRQFSRLALIITISLATVIYNFLLVGLTNAFCLLKLGNYNISFNRFLLEMAPTLIYNLLIAFAFYFALRRLSDWLESRERRIKLLQL